MITRAEMKVFWDKCVEVYGIAYFAFIAAVVGMFVMTFGFGYMPADTTTPSITLIEVAHAEKRAVPPILKRIAECESGNTHYDKNGQVLMIGNTNKTVDVGRYQINDHYQGNSATAVGLDITKEEDNEKYAIWLFENYGTEPWIHSKKCWAN